MREFVRHYITNARQRPPASRGLFPSSLTSHEEAHLRILESVAEETITAGW